MAKRHPSASDSKTLWKRWVMAAPLSALLVILVLWFAVHRVAWLGPFMANTLRTVLGTDNVARLEDTAYAVEDRFNRWWKQGERPKAHWQVPSRNLSDDATGDKPQPKVASEPPMPPFSPADVGPVHKSWSAPGDGQWVPIVDPRFSSADPFMYKTLLHPDRNRSWAELFVVAVDLRRVKLHSVPGYREPKATVTPEPTLKRPGLVPPEHHDVVLAAFNGGFMTEHGRYGMMVKGVTLVPARDRACTIAEYDDGALRIGTWSKLKAREPEMIWYRQAPNCMFEEGRIHPALVNRDSRHWGATLDGDTVIRRSAIGLNPTRDTLYVGITNHTTAHAIATGMRHAGASDVAQLDVNWSYPKFVFFRAPEPGSPLEAVALADGFEYKKGEYLRDRSLRDFFYLTVAQPPAKTAGK